MRLWGHYAIQQWKECIEVVDSGLGILRYFKNMAWAAICQLWMMWRMGHDCRRRSPITSRILRLWHVVPVCNLPWFQVTTLCALETSYMLATVIDFYKCLSCAWSGPVFSVVFQGFPNTLVRATKEPTVLGWCFCRLISHDYNENLITLVDNNQVRNRLWEHGLLQWRSKLLKIILRANAWACVL